MTELPGSGFVLERVFADQLEFAGQTLTDELPDGIAGDITVGWDWRFAEDDRIEVSLAITREATSERPELVHVSLIGVFKLMAGDKTIPLEKFVRLHAPALMMPYARETISSLTSRGAYGPFFLPPVNVVALMERFDAENTVGMRQLRERERIALEGELQTVDK